MENKNLEINNFFTKLDSFKQEYEIKMFLKNEIKNKNTEILFENFMKGYILYFFQDSAEKLNEIEKEMLSDYPSNNIFLECSNITHFTIKIYNQDFDFKPFPKKYPCGEISLFQDENYQFFPCYQKGETFLINFGEKRLLEEILMSKLIKDTSSSQKSDKSEIVDNLNQIKLKKEYSFKTDNFDFFDLKKNHSMNSAVTIENNSLSISSYTSIKIEEEVKLKK